MFITVVFRNCQHYSVVDKILFEELFSDPKADNLLGLNESSFGGVNSIWPVKEDVSCIRDSAVTLLESYSEEGGPSIFFAPLKRGKKRRRENESGHFCSTDHSCFKERMKCYSIPLVLNYRRIVTTHQAPCLA